MPYIITTINPQGAAEQDSDGRSYYVPTSTRTAVATLDEARMVGVKALPAAMTIGGAGPNIAATKALYALPQAGGTIGPLPDGTVIEVEPVDYQTLTDALRGDYMTNASQSDADVVAAFNAQQ